MGAKFPEEERRLTCPMCRNGDLKAGEATVALDRDDLMLVVRGVPAQICENCGEEYLDEDVTARVLEIAEQAASTGVRVEVRDFIAA
jgi:YgiT-type zinc finger domain-containing protein